MKRISSVRTWCRLERFWDALLGLYEGGVTAGRDAAAALWRLALRRLPRRPRLFLGLETLEPRVLLTNGQAFNFLQSDFSVAEGAGLATVTVERVGSSSGTVSVCYGSMSGTATADSDYGSVGGML